MVSLERRVKFGDVWLPVHVTQMGTFLKWNLSTTARKLKRLKSNSKGHKQTSRFKLGKSQLILQSMALAS
jgi:hypothetical protein